MYKTLLTFVALGLLVFVLSGCSSNASNDQTASATGEPVINQVVPAAEFIALLAQKTDAQLLDIRTPSEVAEGSIPGALNYDFYQDNFQQQLEQLDPKKPTFLFCRSGGRSGKTSRKLKEMGFVEVYDLKDGYKTWLALQ